MNPKIHNVASAQRCLKYCLEDKLTIGEDGLKHPLYKDRAEILFYNQCFGGKEELIRQFNEVIELNQNVIKPIFHIVLSLPEHERFSKSKWIEVSRECAHTMGFGQNQFVSILHSDTDCQHVHIVANRIGFDRHLVRDGFTGYRINNFCNDIEARYGLTPTLHPQQKLSKKEILLLRKGKRLDRLKEVLQQTLKTICDYPAFEAKMKEQEIKVYRNEKGIAFLLDQRVVFRGSEAGFPWKKIEATLRQNKELQQKQELKQARKLKLAQEQKRKLELKQAQELKQQLKQEETEQPRLRYRLSHHL